MTAVVTVVAAEAPAVVLVKGWGTGAVALLCALGAGSAGVLGLFDRRGIRRADKSLPADVDEKRSLPTLRRRRSEREPAAFGCCCALHRNVF